MVFSYVFLCLFLPEVPCEEIKSVAIELWTQETTRWLLKSPCPTEVTGSASTLLAAIHLWLRPSTLQRVQHGYMCWLSNRQRNYQCLRLLHSEHLWILQWNCHQHCTGWKMLTTSRATATECCRVGACNGGGGGSVTQLRANRQIHGDQI